MEDAANLHAPERRRGFWGPARRQSRRWSRCVWVHSVRGAKNMHSPDVTAQPWWRKVELHELMMFLGEQAHYGQCEERPGGGVQVREGLHPSSHCLPATYLNNDGLSWLLAVEEPFHIEFRGNRILLHWGANFVPFALYDHVRVSSWGKKWEFLLFCSSCNSLEPCSRGVMQQLSSIPHQRRQISAKEFITAQMMSVKLSYWVQTYFC